MDAELLTTITHIADVLDNGFVTLFVQIAAYITPFFLIPAAFKAGMGAFGTLTGMLNDKSRGFFDRNKKYRQGARQQNWQKFKEGRLNANAISRLNGVQGFGRKLGAFQASDNKLTLLRNLGNQQGAAWQAADSTWKDIVRGRYDKDERTAASKENDDQQQAQTYFDETSARANIARDWKWAVPTTPAEQQAQQERIEAAVQAARNNGGFSESIANAALRAAGRTGTAIDDIEVLQTNAFRVANGNRGTASSLLGEINAVTKQVARNDLAAGYSVHMDLYDKMQAGTITADDFQKAHLQAALDMDGVTFMRMKKKGVTNGAKALQQEFDQAVAAGDNARAAAIAGHIAKIEQSGSYASFTNVDEAADVVVQPTRGTTTTSITLPDARVVQVPVDGRRSVVIKGSTTQQTVNPITKNLETVYQVDPTTGQFITDALTGQRIPVINQAPAPQDPAVTEALKRHSPRAPGKNPDDPDY